ncbi:MAG: conjugal transfer protein TraB [Deltaproteobacteria bacterium RIFOXYD12_FULL_50_9]|nr:MAG: conjugal transfer protein TraB [Deltaproteobacteria bacterium RIFOXYD12_FULL_50_9]
MTANDQTILLAPSSQDVHLLLVGDREIILIGTAHISRKSADLVREVIAREKPDRVCIELDEKRYEALAKRKRWETLNLREIIYRKQLTTLIANLVLASYQKKLGDQLGVMPGTELLEAARAAEEQNIPISLCDRDIRITMRRAWHSTSNFKKSYLLATLLASLFDTTEMTEDKLSELKNTDVLSELMQELGKALPELKKVLIDERDTFLAEKIKEAPGKRIVAVVGAGHVQGIIKTINEDRSGMLAEINTIPAVSPVWKVAGWAITALFIALFIGVAWRKGGAVAGDSLIYWALATGIPAAIGGMLALSHPLTILSALVSAPITTLVPVLGVGHVTAFVQIMVKPPMVLEFERALDDMATFSGWWKNRLLRVFLAFFLPSFGATLGMWLGGYELFSKLFN